MSWKHSLTNSESSSSNECPTQDRFCTPGSPGYFFKESKITYSSPQTKYLDFNTPKTLNSETNTFYTDTNLVTLASNKDELYNNSEDMDNSIFEVKYGNIDYSNSKNMLISENSSIYLPERGDVNNYSNHQTKKLFSRRKMFSSSDSLVSPKNKTNSEDTTEQLNDNDNRRFPRSVELSKEKKSWRERFKNRKDMCDISPNIITKSKDQKINSPKLSLNEQNRYILDSGSRNETRFLHKFRNEYSRSNENSDYGVISELSFISNSFPNENSLLDFNKSSNKLNEKNRSYKKVLKREKSQDSLYSYEVGIPLSKQNSLDSMNGDVSPSRFITWSRNNKQIENLSFDGQTITKDSYTKLGRKIFGRKNNQHDAISSVEISVNDLIEDQQIPINNSENDSSPNESTVNEKYNNQRRHRNLQNSCSPKSQISREELVSSGYDLGLSHDIEVLNRSPDIARKSEKTKYTGSIKGLFTRVEVADIPKTIPRSESHTFENNTDKSQRYSAGLDEPLDIYGDSVSDSETDCMSEKNQKANILYESDIINHSSNDRFTGDSQKNKGFHSFKEIVFRSSINNNEDSSAECGIRGKQVSPNSVISETNSPKGSVYSKRNLFSKGSALHRISPCIEKNSSELKAAPVMYSMHGNIVKLNVKGASRYIVTYELDTNPHWEIQYGNTKGKSTTGLKEGIVLPLYATYATSTLYGSPRLILTVSSISKSGKEAHVGYGCCMLPIHAGEYQRDVELFRTLNTPLTNSFLNRKESDSHIYKYIL